MTLTALLLAFGASQLFWGPLSDRVGRRRVLLIGLAGYTLAAIGSALAGSIEVIGVLARTAGRLSQRYDIVLMDCEMPGMDGYEATRALRAIPEYAGLPIVAVSANAIEGAREKGLEAGMDGYLSKPLKLESLRETIVAHLPGLADSETASGTRLE